MQPTTVQLTDRLPEIIDSTWDEVVDLLKAYFVEHGGDLPCLHDDLNYNGDVDSFIDSAVPIYTSELNQLAYFHHAAAMAALVERFGSADGAWPSGPFSAGLYTLIEQGIGDRWDDKAEGLWQAWLDELDTPNVRKRALSAWQDKQNTEKARLTPFTAMQPLSLTSTTLRTALVNYRAELIRLSVKFPETFKNTNDKTIAELDAVLLSIEGNIDRIAIAPVSCKTAP
jgi:hypothetical protein